MQHHRPKRGRAFGSTRLTATGRRIGSRPLRPGEKWSPLDFNRTLNAAIARQSSLWPDGPELKLKESDLHLQLRSQRPQRLVVFLIDTSDSMGDGPKARMSVAFSAIVAIASTAYLNRDQVCLITFRDREAQLVVPPTDSVKRVKQSLNRLPVGGATPLSAGLQKARQVICQTRSKNQEVTPLLVLISDGEATSPLKNGSDPAEEAMTLATSLHKEGISSLVIDTLSRHHKRGLMPRLAQALGTDCQHIQNLSAGHVLRLIEDTEQQ